MFERAHELREPTRLSVMLPDEHVVELDEHVLWTFGPPFYDERFLVEHDEVLYMVEDGDGWVLRRTVLP